MADGEIIPNVNPRPAIPQPATPATPATRRPAGPVMEQRKVAAAQKAGMIVDARLYGVKPMALAKFINDSIKNAPYQQAYNKAMMNYAKINTFYTKALSVGISSAFREFSEFRKNYVPTTTTTNTLLRTISQQEKISTTKPTLTTKILGDIARGNEEDRRKKIYADREAQKNAYDPEKDPIHQELETTNAELHRLINLGTEQAKDVKKHARTGSMFGLDRLPKNLLVPAAMIAALEIVKATKAGIDAIKDTAQAWQREQAHEKMIDKALTGTKERLVAQGQDVAKSEELVKAQKELDYMQSQLNQPIDRWKTAVKLGIIKKEETYAGAAMTGGVALSESEREEKIRKAIDQRKERVAQLSKEFEAKRQATAAAAATPPATPVSATPTAITPATPLPVPAGWMGQAGPTSLTPVAATQKEVIAGKKGRVVALTPAVKEALSYVAGELGISPELLSKEIDFESAGTWNPTIKNPKPDSTARGLIQFTDETARDLGYKDSMDLVSKNPTVTGQLKGPVLTYLKGKMGKHKTAQGLMMGVLYPKARAVSPDTLLPERVRKWNPGINTVQDYMENVNKRPDLYAAATTQNIEGADIKTTQSQITAAETEKAESQAAAQQKTNELLQGIYANSKVTAEKDVNIRTSSPPQVAMITQ